MSKTYVPAPLRRQVTEDAQRRCGYCLTPERIIGRPMVIDHIVPEAKGGADESTPYAGRDAFFPRIL